MFSSKFVKKYNLKKNIPNILHVISRPYSLSCGYSFLMKSLEDNCETIKNSMMEEPNINKVQSIIQLKLEIAFFNKKNNVSILALDWTLFSLQLNYYSLNLFFFYFNKLNIAIIKLF